MPIQTITLALLNGFKRNHLEIAIADDVSLAGLLFEHKRDIVKVIKSLAFLYSKQKDEFNIKNVLVWVRENRPDLYPIFENSKEARLWLGRQVKELTELFFGG